MKRYAHLILLMVAPNFGVLGLLLIFSEIVVIGMLNILLSLGLAYSASKLYRDHKNRDVFLDPVEDMIRNMDNQLELLSHLSSKEIREYMESFNGAQQPTNLLTGALTTPEPTTLQRIIRKCRDNELWGIGAMTAIMVMTFGACGVGASFGFLAAFMFTILTGWAAWFIAAKYA